MKETIIKFESEAFEAYKKLQECTYKKNEVCSQIN